MNAIWLAVVNTFTFHKELIGGTHPCKAGIYESCFPLSAIVENFAAAGRHLSSSVRAGNRPFQCE